MTDNIELKRLFTQIDHEGYKVAHISIVPKDTPCQVPISITIHDKNLIRSNTDYYDNFNATLSSALQDEGMEI